MSRVVGINKKLIWEEMNLTNSSADTSKWVNSVEKTVHHGLKQKLYDIGKSLHSLLAY